MPAAPRPRDAPGAARPALSLVPPSASFLTAPCCQPLSAARSLPAMGLRSAWRRRRPRRRLQRTMTPLRPIPLPRARFPQRRPLYCRCRNPALQSNPACPCAGQSPARRTSLQQARAGWGPGALKPPARSWPKPHAIGNRARETALSSRKMNKPQNAPMYFPRANAMQAPTNASSASTTNVVSKQGLPRHVWTPSASREACRS